MVVATPGVSARDDATAPKGVSLANDQFASVLPLWNDVKSYSLNMVSRNIAICYGGIMSLEFAGSGLPLDQDGVSQVTNKLGVEAPELWTVVTVETRGCGFLSDRRPVILFERHIFARETQHKF